MQIGMIGLGRMGANMVRRLQRAGHQCVVFDRNADAVQALAKEGATASASLAALMLSLFLILILGVLCVLLVVVVEHYYRTGVEVGQLSRRFVQVTAIEGGVLFTALAIQVIFLGVLGLFTVWSVLLPLVVLALTVGLSWLLTRMPKNSPPA